METHIFCLHGFLGQPEDWQSLHDAFSLRSEITTTVHWRAVDYLRTEELDPQNSFATWALNFNLMVRQQCPQGKRILLGYSLGARLALQALKQNASLWSGAVLLSVNPGLKSEEEKIVRRTHDEQWAQRFRQDPWSTLMRDWNGQSVFSGDQAEPDRHESNYNREQLAQILTQWSLGAMPEAGDFLKQCTVPMVLLSGKKDQKFTEMLEKLEASEKVKKVIVPEAGHRLLFSAPSQVTEQIVQLIS